MSDEAVAAWRELALEASAIDPVTKGIGMTVCAFCRAPASPGRRPAHQPDCLVGRVLRRLYVEAAGLEAAAPTVEGVSTRTGDNSGPASTTSTVGKGPFPDEAFECVLPERRELLGAMVSAARESPLGWRHYPHSPTDYLTDLWALYEATRSVSTSGMGYVVLTRQRDGSWKDDWDGEVHDRAGAMVELRHAWAALGEDAVRLAALQDVTP